MLPGVIKRYSRSVLPALLPLMGLAVAWSAVQGQSLARLSKAGKILVATDTTYPPMEFEDDAGKPSGFDIDLADELARRLGLKAEFVVMGWDGILAGLHANRYDLIVSSMNITPERAKQVHFVEYLRMSQVFVGLAGSVVNSAKEMAGKIVAVQADTTSHEFVLRQQKEGLAVKEIKAFPKATDAFMALKARQADLIVIDEPVGLYYAKQDEKAFQVGGRAMSPEPVGIALARDDDLLAAVRTQIAAIKKDGTFKRLAIKWFGREIGS